MALLDTSRTAFGSRSAVSFTGFAAKALNTVVEWNDQRATRKALSALSTRELEDIGLCRGDIDAVATAQFIR